MLAVSVSLGLGVLEAAGGSGRGMWRSCLLRSLVFGSRAGCVCFRDQSVFVAAEGQVCPTPEIPHRTEKHELYQE